MQLLSFPALCRSEDGSSHRCAELSEQPIGTALRLYAVLRSQRQRGCEQSHRPRTPKRASTQDAGDATKGKWLEPKHLDVMATVCKHPRVRIVSRHEDTEFVECLECGEVFDSEEFHDMEIEDTVEASQAEIDS